MKPDDFRIINIIYDRILTFYFDKEAKKIVDDQHHLLEEHARLTKSDLIAKFNSKIIYTPITGFIKPSNVIKELHPDLHGKWKGIEERMRNNMLKRHYTKAYLADLKCFRVPVSKSEIVLPGYSLENIDTHYLHSGELDSIATDEQIEELLNKHFKAIKFLKEQVLLNTLI